MEHRVLFAGGECYFPNKNCLPHPHFVPESNPNIHIRGDPRLCSDWFKRSPNLVLNGRIRTRFLWDGETDFWICLPFSGPRIKIQVNSRFYITVLACTCDDSTAVIIIILVINDDITVLFGIIFLNLKV